MNFCHEPHTQYLEISQVKWCEETKLLSQQNKRKMRVLKILHLVSTENSYLPPLNTVHSVQSSDHVSLC